MFVDEEALSLNVNQVKEMFLYVGDKVVGSKQLLTDVDSRIGDGDHGIGMSVGFNKVMENLNQDTFTTIGDVFSTVGMSMISSMGGASGIIFGSMFLGGAKKATSEKELNLPVLISIFEESLKTIKKRGKADLGDKTMIDSFQPAVDGLKKSAEKSNDLLEGLKEAEKKAYKGVEDSKVYTAKFGRAKSLGERSLGHQDPGATTVWIIFKSMREWTQEVNTHE